MTKFSVSAAAMLGGALAIHMFTAPRPLTRRSQLLCPPECRECPEWPWVDHPVRPPICLSCWVPISIVPGCSRERITVSESATCRLSKKRPFGRRDDIRVYVREQRHSRLSAHPFRRTHRIGGSHEELPAPGDQAGDWLYVDSDGNHQLPAMLASETGWTEAHRLAQ